MMMIRTLPFPTAARQALCLVTLLGTLSGCSTMHRLEERLQAKDHVPAAAEASVPAPGEYRLGPEDVIEISVWKEDNLKREVLVRPDGGISFPLVGDLIASGKTAAELREEITAKISKFIPEASVSVSVLKAANYRFFVIGRVNKPGDYTAGRPINVLQALAMAGGLTPFASEDSIHVVRMSADGKTTSLPFEYSRVRDGDSLEENVVLQTGDVVVVP